MQRAAIVDNNRLKRLIMVCDVVVRDADGDTINKVSVSAKLQCGLSTDVLIDSNYQQFEDPLMISINNRLKSKSSANCSFFLSFGLTLAHRPNN